MAFEFLEDFGKTRPNFGVNMARMRHDAHSKKMTLFVEGEDDKNFFRATLKDPSRWKIEYGPKKKGVLERYRKYLENPTVQYAVFSADLDFDFAVELLLKKGEGFCSRIVKDDAFFYQLFDVEGGKGYNDLETFLFLSDAYTSMMVEYYDDDDDIEVIRKGIVNVGLAMGAYRVANILVRETCGLGDDISMLCHRFQAGSGERRNCTKFDVDFMDSFGLVDFSDLSSSGMDMIGETLSLEFGDEEFAEYLPLVIKQAHEVLNFLKKNRAYAANFMRGHDLMDLLAHKMAYDRNHRGSSLRTKKRSFVDSGVQDFEKFRDDLESDLRKAAGNSMAELKQFPIGALLK